METNLQKISHFIHQTGTSHKLAQEILNENGWNVEKAVKVYRYMSQTAAVPPGPQKNSENKQTNWKTTTLRASNDPQTSTCNKVCIDATAAAAAAAATVKCDIANGQLSNNSPSNTLTDRRVKRGISTTANDAQIISISRDVVLHNVQEGESNCLQGFMIDTPEYTFILPDISHYEDDFKAFLNKDLIEMSTLVSLEQAGRLNWWADAGACQRLLPLATTGDGNCLLHAASLALWGFHDRLLTLRKALCQNMTNSSAKAAFFRRWRWHQTQINKQSGLIYSEQEWQEEWNNLAKLASAQPRIHPACSHLTGRHSPATNSKCSLEERESADDETEILYESLEEFHVFVLAHVLRRTIIIIADTILKDSNGEALAPISFGGIYMPLECEVDHCHRSPLLLTYDAAHFSALVPMEDSSSSSIEHTSSSDAIKLAAAIPLVDPDFELLPIHFIIDPGPNYPWNRVDDAGRGGGENKDKAVSLEMTVADRLNLLQKYMDIEQIPIPFSEDRQRPPSVVNGVCENLIMEDACNGNSFSDSIGRTTSIESEDSSLSTSNGGGGGGEKGITNGKEKKNSTNGKVTTEEEESGETTDEKKKKKKKDRNKLRNFVRSVGTLRRTLSKTFSRNFCASAKSGRRSEVKSEVPEKQHQSKAVLCTSSLVKPIVVNITEWKSRNKLLCSKLLHRRLVFQEEMIVNYLKSAAERFQHDKDLVRQQDAELRHLTERRRQELELVQCINSGCEGKASAATCYLCQDCFERQKQEEIDMKMLRGTSPTSGTQAAKVDRVDSGPSLPHYVPPGGIPHTQKHPPSSGRAVHDSGGKKGYNVVQNKNANILRSKSQEEATRNGATTATTTTIMTRRNVVMNNSLPNSTTTPPAAPPNYATEVSHLLFYDCQDKSGKTTTTQMTRSSTIPAGTAVIINNLYQSDDEELLKKTTMMTSAANTHNSPNINLNCDWKHVSEPVKYSPFVGDISKANAINTCPVEKEDCELSAGAMSPWVSRDNLAVVVVSVQQKCKTIGCDYYGTDATELLCSACFRDHRNAAFVSNKIVR